MPAAAREHARQQRVRERDRGAQVDRERAVDLLHREGVQRAGGRQRGVGDQDVHVAGLADETVDLAGLDQVDGERARAELLRERLEHLGAPAREDQLAALGGSARAIAWPMPPVAP